MARSCLICGTSGIGCKVGPDNEILHVVDLPELEESSSMEKMFLYKDAKGNVYKLSEKKAASLGYKNKIGPAKDRRFMKDDESTPGRIMDLGSAKGESDQDEDSVPSDAGEGDQETQTPKPKKKSAKNKKREVESA